MIAATRGARPRAGITLTEILIAILIMGVGLISLATLFPLGLIRLREASRYARGGLMFEVAADDMDARQLLVKSSFWNTWYWYYPANDSSKPKVFRDPFTQDGTQNNDPTVGPPFFISSTPFASSPNYVNLTIGVPICYDPLWRSLTGIAPSGGLRDPTLYTNASFFAQSGPKVDDARFGAGVFGGVHPYLRNDPNLKASGSTIPSAWGLQRLTNFIPWHNGLKPISLVPQYNFTSHNFDPSYNTSGATQPGDVAGDIFASPDDLVFNPVGNGVSANGRNSAGAAGAFSSVLPDMSAGSPQSEYRFTWFFTGRQADAGVNSTQFTGEIVVCDGRPFGYDPLPGGNGYTPAGETVVEGIFGVGGASGTAVNDRAVLLRWDSALPDPQVRTGGWIADVTYEPFVATYKARVLNTAGAGSSAYPNGTSFARCYWYQIAKRTDPQPDPALGSGYRSMTVTLTAPVRARTALDVTGHPIHVNAALIMPSVVSVYPRAFEVH